MSEPQPTINTEQNQIQKSFNPDTSPPPHDETEEIPEHFYDSDIASVNEKDFLSDNQPPKDIVQERKFLYKEKLIHVYKTIVRVGTAIDRPARYDKITLRMKQVPTKDVVPRPNKQKKETGVKYSSIQKQQHAQISEKIKDEKDSNNIEEHPQSHPAYFSTDYLSDSPQITYNIGKDYLEIERLITSMKKGETAVFEMEHLQPSKKSGIKIRREVEVWVIGVTSWLTVIDVDCDGKWMKQVLKRGSGHHRIKMYDEVSFQYCLTPEQHKQNQQNDKTDKINQINQNSLQIQKSLAGKTQKFEQTVKIEYKFLQLLPNIIWKLLSSMKQKESMTMTINDSDLRQLQANKYSYLLNPSQTLIKSWNLSLQVFHFHSIDDIYLDGHLLKKTLVPGVSTAKPESSSLIYYALKFHGAQKEVLFADPFFDSDWWEDFGKLDVLGCRKNYLDEYKISRMLKAAMKRMKPAEVAEIQCRDNSMFQFGEDYKELKQLLKFEDDHVPETVYLTVRVYNFTEGKNCFNMELEEKILESRRKKAIAINLLKQNNTKKALKRFQNIISFYGNGPICQQSYDQKIAALMNSILCLMRESRWMQMLPLCDQVLQSPKHGYDIKNIKIKGPGHAKIEGSLPADEKPAEHREEANLTQSLLILDKCLYRKGFALVKLGENSQAIKILEKITVKTEEVEKLKKDAEKGLQKYQKKSVQMYKNMFG